MRKMLLTLLCAVITTTLWAASPVVGDTLRYEYKGIPKVSQQEQEVINILEQNNISFLYDTPYFEDLRTANGGIARYDFILFNKENQPFRLIEIDGEQHFHPVHIFGGKSEFQKRVNIDKQKNEYALIHNIPLVRIPYTQLRQMNYDMIMGTEYEIKGDK